MNISIVNNWFLQIAINENIVYNLPSNDDNIANILNKYLPPLNIIKKIYIVTGPGSVLGARSLMAYITAINFNNSMEIIYIDVIKDWYLYHWPQYYIYFPFTNKKILMGWMENNIYQYKIIDDLPQENLTNNNNYWIDYSIEFFDNWKNKIKDPFIKYWTPLDLYNVDIKNLNKLSIIQYKPW